MASGAADSNPAPRLEHPCHFLVSTGPLFPRIDHSDCSGNAKLLPNYIERLALRSSSSDVVSQASKKNQQFVSFTKRLSDFHLLLQDGQITPKWVVAEMAIFTHIRMKVAPRCGVGAAGFTVDPPRLGKQQQHIGRHISSSFEGPYSAMKSVVFVTAIVLSLSWGPTCPPRFRVTVRDVSLVPQTIYENRPVTTYRLETETIVEQRPTTTYRPMWETETRQRTYTVLRPVQETSVREERYTVLKPVRKRHIVKRRFSGRITSRRLRCGRSDAS